MIAALIFFVGIASLLDRAFDDWGNDMIVRQGQEILKSRLGDKFLLEYKTTNFPEYSTEVTVTDMSSKKEVGYYTIKGDFIKPQIEVLINSTNLRSYKVEQCVLFRKQNGNFMGINMLLQTSPAALNYNEDTKEFVEVAKVLVAKKEWKWIKSCGRLLLAAGDEDMRKTLERYASGQFTQEELELNKNSEYKKEDMQIFAKQALGQK